MLTYRSQNASPDRQWLGYIYFYDTGRLAVTFFGSAEDEVKAKMREFYAKDKAVRDANRKRREEQRVAASKRAKRKTEEA
jgi:hypothetical protein